MIAQTPPMGWNSWDCYGAAVDEPTVRQKCGVHGGAFAGVRLGVHRCGYSVVSADRDEPRLRAVCGTYDG